MPPVAAMNFPGASGGGGGVGGAAASVLGSAAGGFAAGGPIGAAIGAGSGIANALIGKGAANKAANIQSKAAARAEKEGSGDRLAETVVNDYAMRRDAAMQNRNMALHNALLRGSYGVTGLVDPTVNYDDINAPPPDLTGILYGKGGGGLGSLGPQQAPARRPGPGSLGAMFGGR